MFKFLALRESISSIIRQVYDSRKGDFYQLVKKDMEDLDIILTEEEIRTYTKRTWKLFVSKKLKEF